MNTTPENPTKATSDKVSIKPIRPLEGWTVQTAYGTLKTYAGVDLVRLEDVHAWMCGIGVPAADAVYKIFSPFYMACLSAAEDGDGSALVLPGGLHVLNASTWPNGLLTGANRSKVESVRIFASAFPELGHVRFADGSVGGLVYSIAEGALRVWHGVADLNTDYLATWKDRKERESDRKYGIGWPKDDALRKLLGRVAVPIEMAYELWGWGTVGEKVVPLRSVQAAGAETSATDSKIAVEKDPANWGELVQFRKKYKHASWTIAMKNILASHEDNEKKKPASRGVRAAMAAALDISAKRVGELIRELSNPSKNKKNGTR